MTNFNYFTLAPHGIDESTQQYIFECGIEAVGSPPAVNLEYRYVYDSENEENGASGWQPYTVGNTISNTTNQWFGVQFRNDSGNFSNPFNNRYYIKSTYSFDAGGKIMSLLNYMDESAKLPINAFNNLFAETQIHDAHELILPDRVSSNCYYNMFQRCSNLQTAPALPATTLATHCYNSMFEGCASLTTAPELPATTLADYCYYGMFYACTSLQTAPEFQATTLANNCYKNMFQYCQKIDRIVWKSTTIPSSTYCNAWLDTVSASGKFEYTDPTLDVASITRDFNGVPAGWSISLLSPETKLLLKINNVSVYNIAILGKKIASLSINGKKVKSSSGV